jgi:hypothetical protein
MLPHVLRQNAAQESKKGLRVTLLGFHTEKFIVLDVGAAK